MMNWTMKSGDAWAVACVIGLALAPAAAGGASDLPIRTQLVIGGLVSPHGVAFAPGQPGLVYILEKQGLIRIYDLEAGALTATPFLDITSIVASTAFERGLLGVVFDPSFETTGYFYVNYTANAGGGDTVIERYHASNGLAADPTSALMVMTFDQPYANHNGGWLGFGHDGHLYIATGDGGSAGDPLNAGQDIVDQRLGKMLRVDVTTDDFPEDPNRNYGIPKDNPFVGVEGDDEIWAYGLRNPWRCSFDRLTGDLWIGDVGQGSREEIDLAPFDQGGLNFGWRCKEGTICFGFADCPCGPGLTDPVWEYAHDAEGGHCVIGGYVYRGCAIPEAQGMYFFVDYYSDKFWSFEVAEGAPSQVTVQTENFAPAIDGTAVWLPVSFGEDHDGELYIVTLGSGATGGAVFRVIRDPEAPPARSCEASPADLNGDGQVDGGDLGMLLSAIGACPVQGACVADLDGNAIVDGGDIGLLLAAFSE